MRAWVVADTAMAVLQKRERSGRGGYVLFLLAAMFYRVIRTFNFQTYSQNISLDLQNGVTDQSCEATIKYQHLG